LPQELNDRSCLAFGFQKHRICNCMFIRIHIVLVASGFLLQSTMAVWESETGSFRVLLVRPLLTHLYPCC
jgi:hypothetical protein